MPRPKPVYEVRDGDGWRRVTRAKPDLMTGWLRYNIGHTSLLAAPGEWRFVLPANKKEPASE